MFFLFETAVDFAHVMLYNLAKGWCIMNNKVLDCLSHNGFILNKNRAFATIDGYHFNAVFSGGIMPVLKLHVSFFATLQQQQFIQTTLTNSRIKGMQTRLTDYGIEITFAGVNTAVLTSLLPSVLTFVTATCKNYGALNCNYCPLCGAELAPEEKRVVQVEGIHIALDNKCIDRINDVLAKKYHLGDSQPNNYGKGFLGALLGALIGGVVGLGSSFIGAIPIVAVVLSVCLGMMFYKKFKAKQNNVMFVMVGCLTLLFQLGASLFSFMISAHLAVLEMGGQTEGMWQSFTQCMLLRQFSNLFYISLMISIVTSAICIFVAFFMERKKQHHLIEK